MIAYRFKKENMRKYISLLIASLVAENSLFAKYSPPKWRSTAFGVKFVLALGVAALAVPLVSWAHRLVGEFTWLLVILAVIAAIAAVFTILLPGKKASAVYKLPNVAS